MTEKQRITARKIIEALVSRAEATAAELCAAAGVSRPTALSVINALTMAGIVSKKGIRYGFYGNCSAVLLKAHREGGEIVEYSLGEGERTRVSVDFSPMLSYADNVRGLVKRAESYSDFLRRQRKVFTCLIYGKEDALFRAPAFIDLSLSRDDILAEALFSQYGAGSLLYAEPKSVDMLLCKNGSVVKRIDGGACGLHGVLSLLKPDTVALGGEESRDIAELCRENRIKTVEAYKIDEREALIRLLLGVIEKSAA